MTKNETPSTVPGERGQKITVAIFIPLPFEAVNQVDHRVAGRIQSRLVDRVARAGWPWDGQVSLMVDALQVRREEAEDRQGVAV